MPVTRTAPPYSLVTAGLNLIQQGMSVYDDDLRLVMCNRPFRTMFHLPAPLTRPGARFEDTIRHQCEVGEYGPIDDIEASVRLRVEQARAFRPHYMERTRANGRVISVEGAPLPQGGWVTVYTDITDTQRQERLLRARSEELSDQLLTRAEQLAAANRELQATNAALEEARQELTEMEARTRLTTEMMPAHIAHISGALVYTFSNGRLNMIMPGRPSNIIGMHIAEVLGQQAFQAVRPYIEAALAGRSSVFEFSDEASGRRIRTAKTPDNHGGVYILSMDVTEETQTRAALQQTRRRELAAQVTSGMAHDFSNLLTIILGLQSQLARMDLPGRAPALVSATQGAAKRGGVLLNRIADMTSGRDHQPAATDWVQFLDDIRTLAASALGDNITLHIEDGIGAAKLWLDAGMLQDSLLNLVLNARDAIGPARGRITLRASPRRDTWIEVQVTDTGPGFSAEALARGLDPFFTTKGGEGSGLGLSMVYDMTQRAGGRMRLDNPPGRGAQVTLHLPWRHVPEAIAQGLVLLVEDSPDLRQSIRDMLREIGHPVIEATSTEEALTLTAEVPGLSMILSDLTLEGTQTGIDLFDNLPADAPPCFMMTSLRRDHPMHRDAIARGPVLQKPFDLAALAAFLSAEDP
ncbi:PAS-domain containing protein [Pseudooceanicola aestuarii]|uniref:PAS-domain containing protein n=1 Tax=Pseudooceanicola aestuarii TaxID=2697319 RepID=UPI0013D22354|nr:PAS-domain containing protein [Pseudooceanicola aestuarii]